MESANVVGVDVKRALRDGHARSHERMIVLPEAAPRAATPAPRVSLTDVLAREFDGVVERNVVERVTAAARHALERSRIAVTPDAVERLARERLRVHAASRDSKRHRR